MMSSVPDDTVIYAVGDIHGRLDLLQQLEEKIAHDAAGVDAERRLIVYLGDYIDRGDDSSGVIEHLLKPPLPSFERVSLIGNHEAHLLRFFDDSTVGAAWLLNGGGETLESYGVAAPGWSDLEGSMESTQAELRARMPEAHKEFLQSLEPSLLEGDYYFVVPFDQQEPHDLVWIREEFLLDKRDHGAVVVHGHSIRRRPENLTNRIGVDTGAFASGRLTCVVLTGNKRRFLATSD
jgi:serine/threonine protein phosphatase 1